MKNIRTCGRHQSACHGRAFLRGGNPRVAFCASGIATKVLEARGLSAGPPTGLGEMIVRGKLRAEKDRCKRRENAKKNKRDGSAEKSLVGRLCARHKRRPLSSLPGNCRNCPTNCYGRCERDCYCPLA